MAATPVAMPRLGMTMREGRVVAWPVAPGGFVARGDTIVVIESEKTEFEVEAPASGWLRQVFVPVGETVPCGTLLAALSDAADEPFDAERFRHAHGAPTRAPADRPGATEAAAAAHVAPPAARRGERLLATPAARRRARELGVGLEALAGSGPGGRITEADVEAHAERGDRAMVTDDGVRLEVLRAGSGDALLLLPGFGTDVSVFARQTPALAAGFEVFGVNPRGVGGSGAPEAPRYDVVRLAEDAAGVAPGPAHVVGTSLGAAVALELALRHPERVRSLALLAPIGRPATRLRVVLDAWCRIAAEAKPATLATALLPWLFSADFLADPDRRDRVRRGLATTLSRTSAASLARTAAGLAAWEPPDASGIGVPTLVIAGGGDLLTPDGEAWARRLPRAHCRVLPGVGHALGLEAPDEVNRLLLEHLSTPR